MDLGRIKIPSKADLPIDYITNADFIRMPVKHEPLPSHIHPNTVELVFLYKGTGKCYISQQILDISSGYVCAVLPNTVHRIESEEGANIEYLSIQLDPTYISGHCNTNALNRVIKIPDFLNAVLCEILDKFEIERFNNKQVLEVFEWLGINYLVAETLNFYNDSTTDDKYIENPRIFEVWQYIKNNYSKDLDLTSLSQKFLMSPSTLSRLFKNTYHISPINFAIDCRTSNAAIMLSDTNLSVKEISEAVGYDNVSYFSLLFTRRHGCSPLEYRKQNRKKIFEGRGILQIMSLDLQPDQDLID